ncbi:MAG TPA: transglycosylase SLT domain-containing protein [Bacteroidota bacterium]|nr:transglycosylase SLT domain-containing protein [Bacteroidota bacterium]
MIPLSSYRFFEYSLGAPEPWTDPVAMEIPVPRELHREDYAALRKFSGLYGVDYRLVLAVAEHESRFNRLALSPRGAMGLLQIMPATGRELLTELKLSDLSLPAQHLRAGIYYFSKLSRLFSSVPSEHRSQLALAAYNAGPSRIYDAQELAAYLGEDPRRWSSIRHVLPLLSRRYSSLHAHVWPEGRPPHGYFAGWKETVRYVDRVMSSYTGYLPPGN